MTLMDPLTEVEAAELLKVLDDKGLVGCKNAVRRLLFERDNLRVQLKTAAGLRYDPFSRLLTDSDGNIVDRPGSR